MLEELLAPLKWVDEQLLGAYTWYAVKIEKETGMDKFDLAAKYNSKAKWLFMANSGLCFGAEHPFFGFSSLALSGINLFEEKVLNNLLRDHQDLEARSRVKDTYLESRRKEDRKVRLPLMGLGIVSTLIGFVEIYNFLSERDTTQFLEGVRGIAEGYAWFSWSSAAYIRSSDPKLLDRESLWQKPTGGVKEKQFPELKPQPVPVTTTNSLEGYLN